MKFVSPRRARIAHLLATTLFVASAPQVYIAAHAEPARYRPVQPGSDMELLLPTGVFISPTAIPGSNQQFLDPQLPAFPKFIVSQAVRSALSPDGNTLAIITAGYNLLHNADGGINSDNQYIFIFDVSGANKAAPKLAQVIAQDIANVGLFWNGNTTLYTSGGPDDQVHIYTRGMAAPSSPFAVSGAIALGHNQGIGSNIGPNAAGLAVSADGKTLVVANYNNHSISIIDVASQVVVADYDLRPFNTSKQDGVAGGEMPWAVVLKSNGLAFVSSLRDREIVVVNLSTPASPKFVTRVPLAGNPYGMTFSADQSQLFVAQENADQVAVIDTNRFQVLNTIDTRAPAGIIADANSNPGNDKNDPPRYTGTETIAVTISPDGKTLYAVNNLSNSIAVIPLTGKDAYTTTALIPTARAPKDITFSADGSHMYIVNGRSNTGPNPGWPGGFIDVGLDGVAGIPKDFNQYNFDLERASLVAAPVPTGRALDELTTQVAKNNLYSVKPPEKDAKVMDFLRDRIKHVIYVVKENRTFDQVLGDLKNGANVDPSLNQFGAAITPNLHNLATNFVTLDNFMESGDSTSEGWHWLMQGGPTTNHDISVFNVYRFTSPNFVDNSQGFNFNVPIGLATTAARDAATNGGFSQATAGLPGGTANVLPGPADITTKDAPFGRQKSMIFDAVLNAGGTVRNYGWQAANVGPTTDANSKPIMNPFAAGVVQSVAIDPALTGDRTDPYFRSFDESYPDTWRVQEWMREFQQFEANGLLPSLEMLWLGDDHMGAFGSNVGGANTPESQQADNDFAVGKLIETVAHSPRYARNTLVVVIEDDSQDGPDHVDSHRSTTYVAGPYVKQGVVISTHYTQVSLLRTIEDILGTEHMNLNTRYARPMTDIFDSSQSPVWTFNAVASTALQGTMIQVTLKNLGVKYAKGPLVRPRHDAAYWAEATRGFDFSKEDRVPPALFNRVLWKGMKGDKPYPSPHSIYNSARNVRDDDDDE